MSHVTLNLIQQKITNHRDNRNISLVRAIFKHGYIYELGYSQSPLVGVFM